MKTNKKAKTVIELKSKNPLVEKLKLRILNAERVVQRGSREYSESYQKVQHVVFDCGSFQIDLLTKLNRPPTDEKLPEYYYLTYEKSLSLDSLDLSYVSVRLYLIEGEENKKEVTIELNKEEEIEVLKFGIQQAFNRFKAKSENEALLRKQKEEDAKKKNEEILKLL